MENKRRAKRDRLLLVGDELYTIFLILTYLESCGYEVASARSSHNALELLQVTTPDLILFCDDGVPLMDSFTFLKQVRGMSQTSRTPVILISSRNQTLEQAQSLNDETDAYLVKPFELDDLREQVHSMIKQTVSPIS
ncbi:MAG: response regulator [Leptolyngbyaceae cyanobacterium HOT.MB2.61]|jgi:CheY-like chemotaxis protein|nr:response regulator [Leptolyngbyaceae cyanobacterium HOT.MB2.61]